MPRPYELISGPITVYSSKRYDLPHGSGYDTSDPVSVLEKVLRSA